MIRESHKRKEQTKRRAAKMPPGPSVGVKGVVLAQLSGIKSLGCFRCDGTKELCSVCGESAIACPCLRRNRASQRRGDSELERSAMSDTKCPVCGMETKYHGATCTAGGSFVDAAGSVREIAVILGALLAKHGVIDSPAIYDPEGYDNYETIGRLKAVAEDLQDWYAPNDRDEAQPPDNHKT
jgi:hypothetical protein